MQQSYTIYCPSALLGLAGSSFALAGLFLLPLATISLPSTRELTTIGIHPVTEWNLLTSNPPGVGSALVATLIIAAILLLTINLTLLTQHLSSKLIILARLIAITGTITQASLCLLILFSTIITPASSSKPIEITSTTLGLFLLLSFLMTTIGAFLTPLSWRK